METEYTTKMDPEANCAGALLCQGFVGRHPKLSHEHQGKTPKVAQRAAVKTGEVAIAPTTIRAPCPSAEASA